VLELLLVLVKLLHVNTVLWPEAILTENSPVANKSIFRVYLCTIEIKAGL